MILAPPRHNKDWMLMGELAAAADFIRDWDHIEWIKLQLEMLRALKKLLTGHRPECVRLAVGASTTDASVKDKLLRKQAHKGTKASE